MIGIEKLFLKTLIPVTYCERDERITIQKKRYFFTQLIGVYTE